MAPAAAPLREDAAPRDALDLLMTWLEDALASTGGDEVAMTLATLNDAESPDARVVAIRRFGRDGLEYSTDARSHKASQIEQRPSAVLVGYWPELARQLRLHGRVRRLADDVAEGVFASRQRRSQLGAWANHQSAPVPDRDTLVAQMAAVEQRFADVEHLPRPPHWCVHRFVPDSIEYWQASSDRLHDRLLYVSDGDEWHRQRLQP